MREATISAAQAAMPSIDQQVAPAGRHQHHADHHRHCRSRPARPARPTGSAAPRMPGQGAWPSLISVRQFPCGISGPLPTAGRGAGSRSGATAPAPRSRGSRADAQASKDGEIAAQPVAQLHAGAHRSLACSATSPLVTRELRVPWAILRISSWSCACRFGGHAAVDHRQFELLGLANTDQRQVSPSSMSCDQVLGLLAPRAATMPSTASPWSAAKISSWGSLNWA
jgi:hypothetical protein